MTFTSRIKSILRAALAATVFVALAPIAAAQTASTSSGQAYPSGPIRVVVPFTPGGGTDILCRLIAVELNKSWGQPVLIDNRPGAGGTLGTAIVAKAAGDGQTILVMPAGYAGNSSLYRSLPYDQNRDLAPVSLLASGPLVLVVHPSLPVKSIKELIAFVRARPNEINFGTPGAGTLPHLSAELFNSMTGLKMVQIPYKGAGAAVTDVMAGRVPVYFMNILQSLSLIKAGKLRALGVTTPQRTAIAPEIPTIAEAGLKGFDMTNWYGMLVPSSTPRDVTTKLNGEVSRILKLLELTSRLAQDGMTVVASSPAQFGEFLARETAKFSKVIEAAGIKGSL